MQERDQRDRREVEWKKKRASRITSSNIAKLFQGGRKKTDTFGKGAIDYIKEIVFQIKENDLAPNQYAKQMEFGKENEPLAIEWLSKRLDFGQDLVSGTNDKDDIVFREWAGKACGDSPDGDVYNIDRTHAAVVEIKCPYDKVKACSLTSKNTEGNPIYSKAEVLNEYNFQFAGHLAAAPEANELWYVIYNAHQNEITGDFYDRGVLYRYSRVELQPLIERIEYRLPKVHDFILKCVAGEYRPEEINSYWVSNDFDI